MGVCLCNHPETEHGEMMARTGAPRVLASGCKFAGCDCVEFRARAEEKEGEPSRNCSIIRTSRKASRAMTDVEKQVWRDACRQIRTFEETFGVRYNRD